MPSSRVDRACAPADVKMSVAPKLTALHWSAVLVVTAALLGCQTGKKKVDQSNQGAIQTAESPVPPPPPMPRDFSTGAEIPVVIPERPPEPVKAREKPKLAIILGPGGFRAFAHAGVIQEIHRMRLPVVAIGGLEMGALAAALYANKGQGFESEWQMLKLKEGDFVRRGLIGGAEPKDLRDWKEYLATTFGSARIEDARIPFACITVNLEKQHVLVMSKGSFAQALPYCVSYPPFFKSFDRHVAGASQLAALSRYFRQRGATHVLFVDVLSEKAKPPLAIKDDANAVIWNVTASALESQASYVQEILEVPIDFEITNFARRRDMVRLGRDWTIKSLPGLLQKLGIEL